MKDQEVWCRREDLGPISSVEVIVGPDKKLITAQKLTITTLKMTIMVNSREISRKIFPIM